MNKAILMGRLTKEPVTRYSAGPNPTAVTRYTLAVNRTYKADNQPEADFINCVAFGKAAEWAEKYLRQGTKIAIVGRLQTGSYINKEGNKVYFTEVAIEEQEFAESKNVGANSGNTSSDNSNKPEPSGSAGDGFMNIPDGLDEELPFN